LHRIDGRFVRFMHLTKHEKVLGAITRYLPRGEQPVPSARHLWLNVNAEGQIDGECRVDGAVSPEVLAALRMLDWPKLEGAYIWKQAYLVRKSAPLGRREKSQP
jgi:hypothetical protein